MEKGIVNQTTLLQVDENRAKSSYNMCSYQSAEWSAVGKIYIFQNKQSYCFPPVNIFPWEHLETQNLFVPLLKQP